jgi:hypothetical protein
MFETYCEPLHNSCSVTAVPDKYHAYSIVILPLVSMLEGLALSLDCLVCLGELHCFLHTVRPHRKCQLVSIDGVNQQTTQANVCGSFML